MRKLVWVVPALLLVPLAGAAAWAGPLEVGGTLPAPAGFSQASQCVAHEGVHYVLKQERGLSPILAYDETGKLVSLEYILTQKDLQSGASWRGLPGVVGRPVDHVDIDYYPAGRQGNPAPYYSVHLYFIDVSAQARICPKSTEVEPAGRVTPSR